MPVCDGYEFTHKLREWEAALPAGTKRRQPVALMSGDSSDAAYQMGIDAGADEFVHKPIIPTSLLSLMETAGEGAALKNGPKLCLLAALAKTVPYAPESVLQDALQEAESQLKKLKEEPSWEIAHMLKGLFGQLYLKELFDQADRIQIELKRGDDVVDVIPQIELLNSLYEMALLGGITPSREHFESKVKIKSIPI